MEDQNQTIKTNPVNSFIIRVFRSLNTIVNPIDKVLLKTPLKNIPDTQRRFLVIVLSFMFFILLITLILGVLFQILSKKPTTETKITPVVVDDVEIKSEDITNPSRYFNDPEILNLNVKVFEVKKSLDGINVNDSYLIPPVLNYDIEF